MVREQYSTLCNKTRKMLPFSFHHRNMLLILLLHWLLQRLEKDQRNKTKKVVKLIKIMCIFFVKFCNFDFGKEVWLMCLILLLSISNERKAISSV